jgi:hypothetical protein
MRKLLVAAATVAIFALLVTPALGGQGAGRKGKLSGAITVPDAVYGGMTTAAVNPGGTDVYVFVRCYTPNLTGE